MWKYIYGTKYLIGGTCSLEKGHYDLKYCVTPPSQYWYFLYMRLMPLIRIARETKETPRGISLRYNDRFWMFFWKPLCDGWFDENKVWHKSNRFQYLTFKLGSTEPNKGNNMNEITYTAEEAANVPFDLDNMVEVLDAEGNPTGQYKARDGEAAPEGTTFVTAEDGEHEVTVH